MIAASGVRDVQTSAVRLAAGLRRRSDRRACGRYHSGVLARPLERNYFELTTSPNVVYADIAVFDLEAGAPVMMLDPEDVSLAGDVPAACSPLEAPS